MQEHIIVWDLETVPDLEAFATVSDLADKSEAEIRDELGNKFPKLIFHRIVCIGALIASRTPTSWQVEAVGAPHIGERSERDLIQAFVDKIGELRPRLVTFNGSSFDLPVLRYRAMINNRKAEIWTRKGKLRCAKNCLQERGSSRSPGDLALEQGR